MTLGIDQVIGQDGQGRFFGVLGGLLYGLRAFYVFFATLGGAIAGHVGLVGEVGRFGLALDRRLRGDVGYVGIEQGFLVVGGTFAIYLVSSVLFTTFGQ